MIFRICPKCRSNNVKIIEDRCPKCGSDDVEIKPGRSVWFTNGEHVHEPDDKTCRNCGCAFGGFLPRARCVVCQNCGYQGVTGQIQGTSSLGE